MGKVTITKNKGKTWPIGWHGRCTMCRPAKCWDFHFFGASLGFGLEHIRRHHG